MYETQDHLITCVNNSYISKEKHDAVWKISEDAIKLLDGIWRQIMIKYRLDFAKNYLEDAIELFGNVQKVRHLTIFTLNG